MPTYTGAVAFVEGVHYPSTVTIEGQDGLHPDLSRPLRVDPDGTYRDALEGEELHNDMNHEREFVIEPGSED